MDNLRRIVVLIILVALGGGIWARYLYARSDLAESLVGIRQPPQDGGLNVTGSFDEPLGGAPGLEVSFPSCPRPIAVLPVSMKRSAIIPSEYRYRHGDFDVSYVYNGGVYPEAGVNYKLNFLHVLYRFQSMFGLIEGRQFAFYLKIWVPSGCPGVSTAEASALERGLIARIEREGA
jgi:hypothetical protein